MNSVAWGPWVAPLLRHLWQSTLFVGGIWLLTLALRGNAARMRYRLWMAASLKFLIPFSLLIAVGARLPRPAHPDRSLPAIATVVNGVARPLLQPWPAGVPANPVGAAADHSLAHVQLHRLPFIVLGLWAMGTLLLLARWAANWLRLRTSVRRGELVTLADGTRARVMDENVEPGVFGIVRPVLVLPRGITERLSAGQLDAIVIHELCHMRRRDNLTAALHMLVEALFWFHPAVWWLQARLVEERECACDEAVVEATRQPFAYAEGILSVCRFYVAAPLECVSGVTGSELKQRIARILSGQAARAMDLRRKALLAVACLLAVAVPLTAGLMRSAQGQTPPSAAVAEAGGIAGTWQGTMRTPDNHELRVVVKIAKDSQGNLSARFYNLDLNGPPMNADTVSFEGGTLRFVNQFPGLTYEGKMSADRNSIGGTLTQNGSFPLLLERATAETEWTIPAQPPKIPAMAPDATPGVQVATIKPAAPDARRFMFSFRGTDLVIENLTLEDVMKFVYQVQSRELIGAPAWTGTERWDIEAKPDTPGMPSQSQLREMMQKLLADRFALKTHEEKREMAAYALTVGKDGPKLTRSADASGMGGFSMGPLGVMHAGAATMTDFAQVLQGDILDRPVVDKTGLTGRWNFVLQWMPDETQFVGAKVPRPAPDDSNPLPPLFTAIQEQLGLKLDAQKMDVPVLVIDHVAQPSPN